MRRDLEAWGFCLAEELERDYTLKAALARVAAQRKPRS